MPNCNNNKYSSDEKKMKNKKTRMRVAHITLCDLLTTLDPVDNDLAGISGSTYENSMNVEFCQVRKEISFYLYFCGIVYRN